MCVNTHTHTAILENRVCRCFYDLFACTVMCVVARTSEDSSSTLNQGMYLIEWHSHSVISKEAIYVVPAIGRNVTSVKAGSE